MHCIHLHTREKFMALDANFIEDYMPAATPVYSLIYIYALNCAQSGVQPSTLKLAETFRIRKSEVLDAWQYWQSVGLVELVLAEPNQSEQPEIESISFLPIQTDAPKPAREAVSVSPAPIIQEIPFIAPILMPTERPKYSVEELTLYKNQSADIARLFDHAEKSLAKMLTYNDLNILFGFHDWLRMSVDLIVHMLDYCAANGGRDMRYIEKVALDWAERGIKTIAEATDYTAAFDKNERAIMSALGAGASFPSPTQRKYMNKWLIEWQMPLEMILDACDKTAVQIGKPKLTYVDKILGRWHKEGIKTTAEAATDAENFAAASSAAKSSKSAKPETRARRNRFANFKPRERDYEMLERLEREYQIKSLQGAKL